MKVHLILVLLLAQLIGGDAKAQPFVTLWDLTNLPPGSLSTLTFGVGTQGSVSYTWESIPAGFTGSGTFNGIAATISGLPTGYMIRLFIDTANFRSIDMTYGFNSPKLIAIEQWGGVHWSTMADAFAGCINLNIPATDIPDLSAVSDMSYMFKFCSILNGPANMNTWNTANVTNITGMFEEADNFNQPIGNWNTANVTQMDHVFSGADSFDQPIGNWNTANVTRMEYMFKGATSFNQPLANWNTANVTRMSGMFYGATSFNQPIGNWNTANVNSMSNMFADATSFNQPIGNWNTANVAYMSSMFADATSFNQPIGNWNTANVTHMANMFTDATSFNQPVGNWNTSNVVHMNEMFLNATSFNQSLGNWQFTSTSMTSLNNMLDSSGLDCTNYSATLSGWRNNPILPNYKGLGALGMKYYAYAEADRTYLVLIKGWGFLGDHLANQNCCIMESVSQSGANLSSDAVGAAYQWLRCNPYQLLPGETNQNYFAVVNGSYAVVVTKNGCIDTSACVTVTGIGVEDYSSGKELVIYPNPTKGKLTVAFDKNKFGDSQKLEMFNTLGQLLLSQDVHQTSETVLDLSHLPKGIYYLRYGQYAAKVLAE